MENPNTIKLQYGLSNGKYISCDERNQEFFLKAVEYTKKTPDEIISLLDSGKEVNTGDDWYSAIRSLDFHNAHKAKVEKTIEARYNSATVADCGCYTSDITIMSTSNGSSCPTCYDRMSN